MGTVSREPVRLAVPASCTSRKDTDQRRGNGGKRYARGSVRTGEFQFVLD